MDFRRSGFTNSRRGAPKGVRILRQYDRLNRLGALSCILTLLSSRLRRIEKRKTRGSMTPMRPRCFL